jgi:group I intron endonuclease
MSAGIYIIINKIDDKRYIGSSINLSRRKNSHFRLLRNNKHSNKHLQNAYNKYGEDHFIWNIIEECDKKDCIKREQFWLDLLKPEYNIRILADSNLGMKYPPRTEAAKLSTSKSLIGRKRPLEVINKIKNTKKVKGTSIRALEARSKKVIDNSTGIVYKSRLEVCKLFNLNYANLGARLRGSCKNDTTFQYHESSD